jgi:hypothetical protein
MRYPDAKVPTSTLPMGVSHAFREKSSLSGDWSALQIVAGALCANMSETTGDTPAVA